MQPHFSDHILLTHPPEVAVVANVSTFELSSFPAFCMFYWEIALATCRGHGKYFAGTTLCLLTSPRRSSFMWKSLVGAWIRSSVYYWLVMRRSKQIKVFWKKKWWEFMTGWNFPSALELEMMSAAWVPLAGVIKKWGSEFPEPFFVTFPHSFGTPVDFVRLKLEVRQRIWAYDTFQSSFPLLQSFQSSLQFSQFWS